MNIRENENALFHEWRNKYLKQSFVIDGCPHPDIYSKEAQKVVFVLKDGNLGDPGSDGTIEERTYDQRAELEKEPTLWWLTIARWAFFIQNPQLTWEDGQAKIQNMESIREVLSHHCIVQLKKTWGGGSVANAALATVIESDKNEIIRQLSIYQPHFVVACGNGEFLSRAFGLTKRPTFITPEGIGYWEIKLGNKHCFLIDYCHPSIRAGTKVKGLIAKGVALCIQSIKKNPDQIINIVR